MDLAVNHGENRSELEALTASFGAARDSRGVGPGGPLRGADRDRTDDPRLAKPVLSQLSYSPMRLVSRWATLDLN